MAVAFTQLPPLVLVDLRFTSFLKRAHTLFSVFSCLAFPVFFLSFPSGKSPSLLWRQLIDHFVKRVFNNSLRTQRFQLGNDIAHRFFSNHCFHRNPSILGKARNRWLAKRR